MDFDFFFKMVCTISFAGVTLCLCIKWIVEAYLDYVQVQHGIQVITLRMLQEEHKKEIDDDPTAY
jgi:hypothetical protein